jgi:hypothetical protein
MRRTWAAAVATLLGITLAPPAAPAAEPVTHRTVYATMGQPDFSTLLRLTLDRTGKVVRTSDVAPDGIRYHQMTDVARDRYIYVAHRAPGYPADQLVVRRPGADPLVIPGSDGVFTPNRGAVLIRRRLPQIDGPNQVDAFVLRNLTGTGERALFYMVRDDVLDYRYSLDGKSIWVLVGGDPNSPMGVQELDVASGEWRQNHQFISRCRDFEMLPSGHRIVLACETGLRVLDLRTGRVTGRFALAPGRWVDRIEGRLAPRTMFVSGHSDRADGPRWLGALDLDTFRVEQLRGSANLRSGAAAY